MTKLSGANSRYLGRFRSKKILRAGHNQMATGDFDPEGSAYDYETAKQAGIERDYSGHWPSLDPKTGMVLKGRQHPTFQRTEEAETERGAVILKRGKRYYSVPEK